MSAKKDTTPVNNDINAARNGRLKKRSSLPGMAIRNSARSVSPGLTVRNYSPGPYAAAPRTSLAAVASKVKARKVLLYRNGDHFFKGFTFAIATDKLRTFDVLLSEIGRCPVGDSNAMPKGVRYIFSLAGKPITKLEDLVDGGQYVCSSASKFRKLNYRGIVTSAWINKAKLSESEVRLGTSQSRLKLSSESELSMQPRFVYVIRSGPKPRNKVRLLLSKKTAGSFDQVLTTFAKAVNMKSGVVRQLYTVSGQQVTCLKDLFLDETAFIAYGADKFSREDLCLDNEEAKFIQNSPTAVRRSSQTRPVTRSGSKIPAKSSKGDCTRDVESASDLTAVSQNTVNEQVVYENDSMYDLCQQLSEENTADVQLKSTTVTTVQSPRPVVSVSSPSPRSPDAISRALSCVAAGSESSIEPDSLMISSSQVSPVSLQHPSLKLCDFGLATELGPTPLYDVCGTPSYMAPEMVRQTGYGSKVDVWAAGLVGCVLLTGTAPFFCDSPESTDVLEQVLPCQCVLESEIWEVVGKQAKDLITFLLEDNVDARASAAIALEHPWLAEDVGLQRNLLPAILTNIRLCKSSVKKSVDAHLAVLLATAADKSSCCYRRQSPDHMTSSGCQSASCSKPSTPRSGKSSAGTTPRHALAHVSPATCSVLKSSSNSSQKSPRLTTKSEFIEGYNSKDESKHVGMSLSNVTDNGEGAAANHYALEPDASASSSIEYASLCESMDTLHSAGDNWPHPNSAD